MRLAFGLPMFPIIMRSGLVYLLLFHWFAAIALGADPVVAVELPPRVETKPGKMVRIEAKTQGKLVRWHLEGAEGTGELIVMESTRAAIFCSPQSGSFRIVAWTAIADQPSEGSLCVVEVREGADALAELRQLARTDSDPSRRESLGSLARIYREGSRQVRDGLLKTLGEVHDCLTRLANRDLAQGALPRVRDHLARLTLRELPRQAELPLDEALTKRITTWFDKVAMVLEQESQGEAGR